MVILARDLSSDLNMSCTTWIPRAYGFPSSIVAERENISNCDGLQCEVQTSNIDDAVQVPINKYDTPTVDDVLCLNTNISRFSQVLGFHTRTFSSALIHHPLCASVVFLRTFSVISTNLLFY